MNKTTIVENQTKDNTNSKPSKRIREDKPRKKDEKSVDHVLRALDSLGTTEEKLGAMCQKYAEMFNDHRMLQTAVKQAEKKNTVLQKEKEQLQAEHSKAILTRSRLENLCRELQRQNKAVKEECMLKMREEGEKKREVAAKFHSMLSEIGSLLAQNNDKNAKLRDDNLDMSMRLKSVCDQFEKKEQHVENLAKQMQLEMQLADAKLAKAKMEMDIEKETLQKEKQQLLIELADYKRKLCEMKASELALREQITMYSEKYEEFHKALLQSNSAIGEFKAEMERMTKHIRRLEKETATWKCRYDAAQRTLAEVTQGKLRSDEALCLSQRRLVVLQGICRGLQDQCRQLRGETRRNSQTDEDYRRLEAQIKEVESADDLDTRPCPRKVSFTEDVSNKDSILVNSELSEVSATNNVQPVEMNGVDTSETVDIYSNHNSEPTETYVNHNLESTDIISNVNLKSVPTEVITALNSDVVNHSNEEKENNEIEDTLDSLDRDNNLKQIISLIENETALLEIKNLNGLDTFTTEMNCPQKSIDFSSKENYEKEGSLKEKEHDEKLGVEENSTSSKTEMVISQSIEDCVSALVDHIQEVSLLEGNPPVEDKADIALNVNEELEKTCSSNDVPLPGNSVAEATCDSGVSLSHNSEISDHTNSDIDVSIKHDVSSSYSQNDEMTNEKSPKKENESPLNDDVKKITSSPEDAGQTKNKKKRKSKK